MTNRILLFVFWLFPTQSFADDCGSYGIADQKEESNKIVSFSNSKYDDVEYFKVRQVIRNESGKRVFFEDWSISKSCEFYIEIGSNQERQELIFKLTGIDECLATVRYSDELGRVLYQTFQEGTSIYVAGINPEDIARSITQISCVPTELVKQ